MGKECKSTNLQIKQYGQQWLDRQIHNAVANTGLRLDGTKKPQRKCKQISAGELIMTSMVCNCNHPTQSLRHAAILCNRCSQAGGVTAILHFDAIPFGTNLHHYCLATCAYCDRADYLRPFHRFVCQAYWHTSSQYPVCIRSSDPSALRSCRTSRLV